MNTSQILRTLNDTPNWLRAGLARLSDADARVPPQAGEWSLADILAHLRASDAILAPRVFHILVREDPPLIGFDERAWATVAARAQLPLMVQLDTFVALRAELLGVLHALDEAAWDRAGHHETRGRMTLRDVASDLAEHELQHRAQWDAMLTARGLTPLTGTPDAGERRPRRRRPPRPT